MNSPSFQRRSLLRTDTAQSKTQGPVNKLCRGRHRGLDDETKISDFPVKGEVFQDFPHFFTLDCANSQNWQGDICIGKWRGTSSKVEVVFGRKSQLL